MKTKIILLFLNLTSFFIYSQNFTLDWNRYYNNDSTSNMSQLSNVVSDSAGNFYISATNFVFYSGQLLKKIDGNGNQIFLKTLTIPDCFFWSDTMAIDDSANVYLGGFIQGNGFDAFVVKYDSSGNLLWLDTLETPLMRSSKLTSFTIDQEHNVFTTGTAELDTLGTSGVFTAKISNSGATQWIRVDTSEFTPTFINIYQNLITVLQTEWSNILSVQMDTSGNIVSSNSTSLIQLPGWTIFNATDMWGNVFTAIPDDVSLMKLIHWDYEGNKIWEKDFPGFAPVAILALDSSIYCVVQDYAGSANESILKLNYNGDTLWKKAFSTDFGYGDHKLINYNHDKLFISKTIGGPTSISISLMDTSGVLIVYDTINELNRFIIGKDIAISPSGRLIQIGYTQLQNDYKYLVAGFDSTLQEVFRNSGKDYFDANDIARYAILDHSNNLITVSETDGFNQHFSIQVLKYSDSGNLIWERKFNFIHDIFYSIQDLNIDAHNSIWFCGRSNNDSTSYSRGYAFKIDSLGDLVISHFDTLSVVMQFSKIKIDQNGTTHLGGYSGLSTQSYITTFDSTNAYLGRATIYQSGVSSVLSDFVLFDNSYYILNNINTFPQTGNDFLLQKSNLTGNEIWHIRLSNTLQSSLYNNAKIHLTSGNKIICFGNKDTLSRSQSYLATIDTSGNILWENYSHGTGYHTKGIVDLVSDSSGNLYFTGNCNAYTNYSQWYVSAVNENGTLLWVDSSSTNSRAGSIAINNGLIYVSGFDTLAGMIIDRLLIYDLSGNIVYQYSLPDNLTKNIISKILVDTIGNCYYINNYRTLYNTEDISLTNFDIIPNSINEIKDESIFSFPNPATNFIFISFPGIESRENIKIYSSAGSIALTESDINISKTGAHINISKLSRGIYFFTIIKGSKTFSGKFVKIN